MVGDAARDLEAGYRAGIPNLVLVRTGKGAITAAAAPAEDLERWIIVEDLPAAARWILRGAGWGR